MNRKRCKFTKIIAAILIAVMICGNAGVKGFGTKITAKAATPIERTLYWNMEHNGTLAQHGLRQKYHHWNTSIPHYTKY